MFFWKKIMYIIYMIRSILLIALGAVLSFATPFGDHGKLSVKNGKIVDKNDKEFVLRGMSMFWNKWTEGSRFYKQSTVSTLAGSSWNANVIRVAIGDGNTSQMTEFMDWTSQAGIYVIADWHYHDIDQNGATNFFRTVSNHAKTRGYTHVLYEVYNEPIKQSWSQVKSYAEAIIDVIRANDPDGIIIVGNPNYSADLSSPKASPIAQSKAKNVMYTLHFYTSDPNHNAYKAALQVAWCDNFPVFATEWGTSFADGNGTQDWTLTNGWMSLVETLGISWANWSVTDKGESSAALSQNCCGGGTFSDGNLSASGKYVQQIMKARNAGGGVTSGNGGNVSLTQLTINCGNPAEKGQKTGIVKVGGAATNAVDFVPGTMSGAKDSVILNSAPVLQGNASTFSVSYKLTDLSGPGKYKVRLRYGSTAAATVSLQGDGVESASAELASTGGASTWKNADYIPINVTASGSETTLKLTFTGANNFVFVNILAATDGTNPNPISSSSAEEPSSSSSAEDPASIDLHQIAFTNSLNAMQNSINLQVAREASFKVFDLKGNQVRSLKFTQGSYNVSLADLPKGLYIVKAQFGSQKEILRVPIR
jgi:endoglucanase